MQLPPALRQAIEQELYGVSLTDLKQAAQRLSDRYRTETRDGHLHLGDELAARAYLTARLPATFAAIDAAYAAVAAARPGFQPRSILDVGAGPGTATWAAVEHWPSLTDAVLIEASPAIRAIGARLAQTLPIETMVWHSARMQSGLSFDAPSDLVVLAYVLDELEPSERIPLLDRLWRCTSDTLVLVEPGTPAGWKRILQARDRLIAGGAHMLAPCPHKAACPLSSPDWCHFAARVERSRLHREAKSATVPWEDEKFIYLAASRQPGEQRAARIIAPPDSSKAGAMLKLCTEDAEVTRRLFQKRDKASFKIARRLIWGDTLPF